jgi:hypothetical protein
MLGNHSLEVLEATQGDHVVDLEEWEQRKSYSGSGVPSFWSEYPIEWDVEMEVEANVECGCGGRNPKRSWQGHDNAPIPISGQFRISFGIRIRG